MPPRGPSPGRFHQLEAALAVPNFRRYACGQALSLIGTWVETVAQGLLVLRTAVGAPIIGAVSQVFNPRVGIGIGAPACLGAATISRIDPRPPTDRPVTDAPVDAFPSVPTARGDRSGEAHAHPPAAVHPLCVPINRGRG
jgi:hypothetical protein